MKKTQKCDEQIIIKPKELSEGEKQAILKGILNKKNKQDEAASVNKTSSTLDLTVDVDISPLYEAMSSFFSGLANVFNQFAINCNTAANNCKDEAIKILRGRAEKENKDES